MTVDGERGWIEAELRVILLDHVRRPERPIDPGDHLIFDLEIDHDDATFDLIPRIERHFGIAPPPSAWRDVRTFAEVAGLIAHWRGPVPPDERARAAEERRAAERHGHGVGAQGLAGLGAIAGVGLAAGAAAAFAAFTVLGGALFAASLPGLVRDSRQHERDRREWKARREAERDASPQP